MTQIKKDFVSSASVLEAIMRFPLFNELDKKLNSIAAV